MDKVTHITLFVTLTGLCSCQVVSRGGCPSVNVQPNFDVNQYMGKWYEMNRFFAIFQAFTDCVSADYMLQPSGIVRVNNTGYSKISRDYTTAIGQAKVMDPSVPAKLGVKFFDSQPYGDYWVLSTDYTSYSMVWSCSEISLGFIGKINTQFAWILTRSADGIPDSKHGELITMLDNYGINTSKFSRTQQTGCPGR